MQEHRRPRGPMLSEKELLDLVSSLLPIGEENAVHLGPSLIEQLQVGSLYYRKEAVKLDVSPDEMILADQFHTDPN